MNCAINIAELETGVASLDRFQHSSSSAFTASNPNTADPSSTLSTSSEGASLTILGNEISQLGPLLSFTKWAISNQLLALVSHVIPIPAPSTSSNKIKLVEVSLSVLSAPYVDSQLALIHSRLFSEWPAIHSVYAQLSLPPSAQFTWSAAFSSLGAKGPVVLEEYVAKELGVYPSYSESRKLVADILEIPHDSVLDFQTTSRKGWKVVDTRIKDVILTQRPEMWSYIAHWLESNVSALERGDSMLVGQGEVWRLYVANGRIGTATWCKELNQLAWVPQMGRTELVRPFEAQREHVSLSPQLIRVLEKKGVFFGRTGAQKLLLDHIATFDATTMTGERLDSAVALLTTTLTTLAFVDSAQRNLVSRALESSIFPVMASNVSTNVVPFSNLVRVDEEGARDPEELCDITLGGFLVPSSNLPHELKTAIERLDDLAIVTLPRWPTVQQAAAYWTHLSLDSGTSSSRSVPILGAMFEYLAADQTILRRLLRQEQQTLKLPKQSDTTVWLPLCDPSLESLPSSSCGRSRKVQALVARELKFPPSHKE